jgi:hypothetical protein
MRKGPGSVYDKWNISKGYSGQKPHNIQDRSRNSRKPFVLFLLAMFFYDSEDSGYLFGIFKLFFQTVLTQCIFLNDI